ncbi:hypothetical protein [Pedobacter gandavensis]|uniref:hypothetical protein n=1 Tax=Pedobacter gandavensis TaxID=2679963 RepID=UPI00292DC411|nr:hypothetical protein [Pedobacter gandavensis]
MTRWSCSERCYIALICCILLFLGCGLFQKSKITNLKSLRESKVEKVKTAQLNTRNQSLGWSLSSIDDSLYSSSTVLIWPKGEFSFSPSAGFSGMADKVVISGQLKSGRKRVAGEINLEEESKAISLKEANIKASKTAEKETIKERFPVSGWWWVLLLIPLFIGLRWFHSKYKSG